MLTNTFWILKKASTKFYCFFLQFAPVLYSWIRKYFFYVRKPPILQEDQNKIAIQEMAQFLEKLRKKYKVEMNAEELEEAKVIDTVS